MGKEWAGRRGFIRTWGFALGATTAIFAIFAGAVWWLARPSTVHLYTDGGAIRQSTKVEAPREILWLPPSRVGAPVSTDADDYEPRVSPDGRTMYFVRGKAGGGADIYVSTRLASGWGDPVALSAINTSAADELGPEPSPDGSVLFFYSDRQGGLGGYDVWASVMGEHGWTEPVNLGANVNTSFNEYGVAVSPDGRRLLFSSNRPSPGDDAPPSGSWEATLREDLPRFDYDIYESAMPATPGPPAPERARRVDALCSEYNEGAPAMSPIGDFVYFSSDRGGGLGRFDLYRARVLRGEVLTPENLGPSINTRANELDPALSMLGYAMHFSTDREAQSDGQVGYDVYVTESREVFQERETRVASVDWSAVWPLLWLLLLLLLVALLLWLLSRIAADDRFKRLGLLAKCILASIAVHALILLLMAFWHVGSAIEGLLRRSGGTQVALTAPSGSDDLAQQIRGNLADPGDVRAEPMEVDFQTALAATPPAPTIIKPDRSAVTREPSEQPELTESPAPELARDSSVSPLETTAPDPERTPEAQRMTLSHEPAQAVEQARIGPTTDVAAPSPARAPPANVPVGRARVEHRSSEVEVATESLRSQEPAMFAPSLPESPPPSSRDVALPNDRPTTVAAESSSNGVESVPSQSMTALTPPDRPSARTSPASPGRVRPSREQVAEAMPMPDAPTPADVEGAMSLTLAPLPPTAPTMDGLATPASTPRAAQADERAIEPTALTRTAEAPDVSASRPAAPDTEVAPRRTAIARQPASSQAESREMPRESRSAAVVEPSTDLPTMDVGAIRLPTEMDQASLRAGERAPEEIRLATSHAGGPSLAPTTPLATQARVTPPRTTVATAPREAPNVPEESASTIPTIEMPLLNVPDMKLASEMRIPTETAPDTPAFPQRAPEVREAIVERMGGSDETERAVARALGWLARHQSASGAWSGRHFDRACGGCGGAGTVPSDVALTGLSLLCFLGADHTHLKDGPYKDVVAKGVSWLVAREDDGDLRAGESMYSHAIAAIAIAEAAAMTRDPALVLAAERAARFISAARSEEGGWRYEPGQFGDTSVLGWQVMALTSARRAGARVDEESFAEASRWMDRVQQAGRIGLYAYQPGNPATPSMTAEGFFIRQLLGEAADSDRAGASAKFINGHLPDWDQDAATYFWYYATLALFQHGGEEWTTWNTALKRELLARQHTRGPLEGSYDPKDRWSRIGGRVYQTAICTLSLEVYYRYLPMYRGQ